MSIFTESRALMHQALIDTGLFVEMSTLLPGCTTPTTFYGDFRRPDVMSPSGAQSSDYEIHYRYEDAAKLLEGAEVIVGDVKYRVRADPFIDPARGADGYWRSAFLTRVGTVAEP